jgi:phospholipid/cholesterol/gamma-HCH transport system substrate-binding protein
MRRGLITAAVAVAVVVAVALISSSGAGNGYLVRAYFDNGSFMVSGEQVRIAGANVGSIQSVGVSMPGEIDAYSNGKPVSIPGKAIIVMEITNPGFQDFRSDASCLIRPQSLIGEKFVDCNPTLPRAPGSPVPPPLKQVPSGQPGAGQYVLPVENNSTSVDPDLIHDIQTLPYAQRFRLILNELGAGLAGRGKDLEEVIVRANPVLREVDQLLGILNAQRDRLAQLASDSATVLGPLSRERAHVAGFLANAGDAAQASSERGAALEASLRKFPRFLREFRLTMRSLQGFSDAGTPVLADLGKAAPALTEATRELAPFSAASTVALKSLGATGKVAGPLLAEADPIVSKTAEVARSGVGSTTSLAEFFDSTKETGGWNGLVELIYNTTATLNGFDKYGHFARTLVTLTNCVDYEVRAKCGQSANFTGEGARSSAAISTTDLYRRLERQLEGHSGGTAPGAPTSQSSSPRVGRAGTIAPGPKTGGTSPLLNYLLGP